MTNGHCKLCLSNEFHWPGCPTSPKGNRAYYDAGMEKAQEDAPDYMSDKQLKGYDKSFVMGYNIERKKQEANTSSAS